jgi:SAM-dependent methyltransferase
LWFGLSMTPSVLLLATTNQVCLDVAVIPFLWVLPLGLYLLTFILCFDCDRWYSRRPYAIASAFLIAATALIGRSGSQTSLWIQVSIYFSAMFCCCMVCHGELVALKPHPKYLTKFFLTISAGGASGGLFVALVAPLLFVSYYELQFGIFFFAVLYLCLRFRDEQPCWQVPNWVRPSLVAAALLVSVGVLSQFGRYAEGSIAVSRNFYGVLKVEAPPNPEADRAIVRLAHGRIEHGSQFVARDKSRLPTAYFTEKSGIGQLMRSLRPGQPKHVGIVGLGVGTLTAYGEKGDRFRLYEINPDVITMAKDHFSYLKDCPADIQIVIGDARLALEFEEPQQFDILVLDAFTGDAIPVHLLTREAISVYLKHLKPDGVLACHVSNIHFDLRPVIAGLAQDLRLAQVIRISEPNPDRVAFKAVWSLIARDQSLLADTIGLEPNDQSPRKPIVWTDDRSNLFEVLW